MEKVKALWSKLKARMDAGVAHQIEMVELLELIVSHLSKPKTFNFNIGTLVKEVKMAVPTTRELQKELSKTINDELIKALKDSAYISERNFYTEDDMISFATYIHNYKIADPPGRDADRSLLKQWEDQK